MSQILLQFAFIKTPSIAAKISGNVYGHVMYVLRISACSIHHQAQFVKNTGGENDYQILR